MIKALVKIIVGGGAKFYVLNGPSLIFSLVLEDKSLLMANNTPSIAKSTGVEFAYI